MTLEQRLRAQFPKSSRQSLKQWVGRQRVMVNGKIAQKLTQVVEEGDSVRLVARDVAREKDEDSPPIPFVYEDEDMLVVNKPADMLTSTTPREPRATALAAVTLYLRRRDSRVRVGLIHRLDREASGLLVFSKTSMAFASLKRQFAKRTAGRTYIAGVSPPPKKPTGKIESALVEWKDGSVHSTRLGGKGMPASTEYSQLAANSKMAILSVRLKSGRKHQIRAHLSELGSPIIGDRMYGGKYDSRGLMLAAIRLELDHPRTSERLKFEIPTPPRIRELAATIGHVGTPPPRSVEYRAE